jgi:hypothetical protein
MRARGYRHRSSCHFHQLPSKYPITRSRTTSLQWKTLFVAQWTQNLSTMNSTNRNQSRNADTATGDAIAKSASASALLFQTNISQTPIGSTGTTPRQQPRTNIAALDARMNAAPPASGVPTQSASSEALAGTSSEMRSWNVQVCSRFACMYGV